MADGDNQQPQPGVIDPRMIDQIMSALTPQQATPQAQPVDMSQLPVTSLLGLAVGGGPQTGMSQQDATAAGNRALLNFGVNMLAASGYSPIRRTFGETFAQGVKGAEESLASSQAIGAAQKEAQQQYTQQQIANRAEALKSGMSMQELALKLAMLKASSGLPNPLAGGAVAGATPGAPGSGTALTGNIDKDQQIIAQRESGGDPTRLNYVAQADPSARARGATASGKYQFVDSTWREGMQLAGLDPSTYAHAMDAPEAVQDQVFRAVYGKYGTAPWDPSKWSKNWVLDPKTGKYDLQPTTTQPPPPAGNAAADTKGTTTKATTGPVPGTLAPGTTVTAAPTAAGVPPPPGGTETGAYPEAGAGIGRVLAGTTGKVGPAQLTVAPPPTPVTSPIPAGKLLSTGKPPGVADIITLGIKTAQATPVVPGAVAAAGPAAGTPPPAPTAAPAAQPGWGTVIGSYGPTTTAAPPAPTPPPAATATGPVVSAPQPTTQQPTPDTPDDKLTFQQFKARHGWQPTPEERATFTLPQDQEALAHAQAAMQTAAQNLQIARMSMNPEAANKAGADYETAQHNLAQLQAAVTAKNADAERDWRAKQDTILAGQLKDAKDRAAELEKMRVQAGITVEQKGAEAGLADAQQQLTDMGKNATEARTVGNQLRLMPSIIDQLPQPGFAAQLAKDHPALVPYMVRAGALSPEQADATQVMQGLIGYMSVGLRPTGSGALRNAEMDRFQQVLPSLMQSPQGRQDSQSLLQTLQDRIVAEHEYASKYFRRIDPATGKPAYNLDGLGDAMDAPKSQGGLGAIAPQGPSPVLTDADGNPRLGANGQPVMRGVQEVQQWVHDNVGVGHAYWGWQKTGPGEYAPKLMVRRDNG